MEETQEPDSLCLETSPALIVSVLLKNPLGCLPIILEIQPCLPLRPESCPLPPPLTPQQGGLPLVSAQTGHPWKGPPQPPTQHQSYLTFFYGTHHYMELLISFYFVLVCLLPSNRSSRKPGNLAQLDLAAPSKPTGQVFQIIKAK